MNKDICTIRQMREKGRFVVDQPFTPVALISEITAHIAAPMSASVVVLFTVEWALYLKDLGYTNITVSADDPVIENICKTRQLKYIGIDELKKNKNMKFDVVVGNPPFHYMSNGVRVSLGNKLIKTFYQNVNDNGYLAIVASTNFLGGGQQGLGYLFSENRTIVINFDHKLHFPKVGTDIGSFVIQKTPNVDPTSIQVARGDEAFVIDSTVYRYCGNPYIPRGISKESEPILRKIVCKSSDVFKFQSSVSKGMTNKIGFWAAAKTGIHPKYFRITHTGEFENDNITHPCGLDQNYHDDHIRSVFMGKLFHWVIYQINAGMADRNPSNLSYFPKVDLTKYWSFDDLAEYFDLTKDEKRVILDWANSRAVDCWRDK